MSSSSIGLQGQRDTESMGRIPNVGIVIVAVRRANIHRFAPPRAGSNDVGVAISCAPWRTIRWRTLIRFVPAILYPLIDTAAHVVEAKGIRLEAAHLNRLLGARCVSAILAVGHTRL